MVTLNIVIAGAPKEEFSYGLGTIMRKRGEDSEAFHSLDAFRRYIDDLELVHKHFKEHEARIESK